MNKTNIAEHEQVIYQSKEKIITSYKKNPEKVVDDLVNSVTSFLICELDVVSFHKYKRNFEVDCKKALNNIFFALFAKESSFLIFPDIIPGFTTMVYKKNKKYFNLENKKALVAPTREAINFSGKTMNNLFSSFFEKNNQLVLLVESEEVLMMFCPVSDLDKYLKELEVYSLSN